ncbi:MAG TPA: hypothetical protein VGQ83_04855 [Polyangia bacterium]
MLRGAYRHALEAVLLLDWEDTEALEAALTLKIPYDFFHQARDPEILPGHLDELLRAAHARQQLRP